MSSTPGTWDGEVIGRQDPPHFMQSEAWGRFKEPGPWEVSHLRLGASAFPVQAFARDADGYGRLLHLPRVSGLAEADVADFTAGVAASRGDAFTVKLELFQRRDPDLVAALEAVGWHGARATQYRFGVTAALDPDDETMLAGLKKRARTEVRQGERRGIECERVDVTQANIELMLDLVRETEQRSGAFFRDRDYLEGVWNAFDAAGQGRLYFARHDGELLSGAYVIAYGTSGFYKDGGSFRDRPGLPVSRALQWAVMKDLAAAGVKHYDLGNIPDPSSVEPGSNGLLTFKSGFALDTVEYMPAMELAFGSEAARWRAEEPSFTSAYKQREHDSWY